MNETNFPNGSSELPTLSSVYPLRTPDPSALADSEKPAPDAAALLEQAVQGAHDTINKVADSAAPVIHEMGERAAAVEDTLRTTADQLRASGDEWVESARTSVRSRPLMAVAAALTLGLVIARITR
jgi:ElaB/YqjD/DUF883 family membrane-anchored ribosome-binding protein